jgi:hypothetical protein
MVAWTTTDMVAEMLGVGPGSDFLADPYSLRCVAAANDVCFRKRRAAGYADEASDSAAAPSASVAEGATQEAVNRWRSRASTSGMPSYEDLADYTPIGAGNGNVNRLLGIPRANVDLPVSDAVVTPLVRARLRARYGHRF